ncbi:MAG: SGNH/GDSL hydrolase family protein [Verrucomicrobiae bacterium]|nr:SGNH/GDSL hydrolase family protein [Verrucomicrobiae bacterium]
MKKHVKLGLAVLGLALSAAVATAANLLPPGARLAIVGDSITEQKLYSKYMETYLLACAGRTDMKVFQFGWGGERADGFAARAANDLGVFQPTVVTTCYGMNDGQYRPYADDIGRAYEANTRRYVEILKGMGVQHIVLGSPGAVDTRYFVRPNFAPLSGADGYNQNLGRLRDINRRLAGELGVAFADVHQPMLDAMAKAKAALGNDYDVCGRDGFHPGPNGHLIMAYAFLRALGCDGRLAELTVDLQGAPAASAGHKVVEGQRGTVSFESTRYPFCFDPDPKASSSTRSIVPFFPFNEELNRFVLKVRNLAAPRARVTWGEASVEFTREQLAEGVNLAAAFPATPFDEAFRKVMDAVGQKQNFETLMIKEMVTKYRLFGRETAADPALAEAFRQVTARLMARQEALDAAVRKALVPVRHTVTVTPAE